MEEVAIIADSKGRGYYFANGIYYYLMSRENRDFSVNLIDIEKVIFKDGEFKMRINENIRRKKCFFVHDSNKTACEWFTELVFILEAMRFSSPAEINVILPYTRFTRQDRKDESRVSVNIKAVADVVSKYADRGVTVDLHAPQIQEYFNIPFDNLYSFPSLINYLKKNHPEIFEDLVVVAPDLGGAARAEGFVKRLGKMGINADIALGHKTRSKPNVISKMILIGNVENKNCLILDDIIDTGGTLVKAAELLRENKARRVFAYGTHGLFTDGTEKFKAFDKILVSNTLNVDAFENLEVVSLINLFGEVVYRTIAGKSLSILFDGKDVGKQEILGKFEI